jgi:hypothetical protein
VSLLASLLPACNFQHCFIGTHARIFAENVICANGEKIPDSHDIRSNIFAFDKYRPVMPFHCLELSLSEMFAVELGNTVDCTSHKGHKADDSLWSNFIKFNLTRNGH